ncbi:hypothetical protein BJY01DRAFT_219541 [Aspergillus pseudoustus]|uniref:Secreted protein n=1 Tax=Aspergillus pseudoustus TaxID=1810923 RepID=A0ABR4JG06_9EURO
MVWYGIVWCSSSWPFGCGTGSCQVRRKSHGCRRAIWYRAACGLCSGACEGSKVSSGCWGGC